MVKPQRGYRSKFDLHAFIQFFSRSMMLYRVVIYSFWKKSGRVKIAWTTMLIVISVNDFNA